MSKPLRVAFVCSEVAGFSKTGGLADVCRALPLALAALGHEVRILTPFYASVPGQDDFTVVLPTLDVPLGGRLLAGKIRGTTLVSGNSGVDASVALHFLEHQEFFNRPGFYDEGGSAYFDNAIRFGLLSAAGLAWCEALDWIPDILHLHDWHTAVGALYLRQRRDLDSRWCKTRSVLTLHNAGYQGHGPLDQADALGIPWELRNQEIFEDHGQLNLLKGGIALADKLNAVSPGYAGELLTPLGGHGLHVHFQRREADLAGILNGVEESSWNPASDPHLPTNYSLKDRSGKQPCKSALQQHFGLPEKLEIPLFGMVSRLTEQKGFGYLIPALEQWLASASSSEFGNGLSSNDSLHSHSGRSGAATRNPRDVQAVLDSRFRGNDNRDEGAPLTSGHDPEFQVVMLGSGDEHLRKALDRLAAIHPGRLGWIHGYDDPLAHLIEAGSDFFLMPSLYEPCGLNQIYSLRYGTLPIVRAVGGLKDTVANYDPETGGGTGFVFHDPTPEALLGTLNWVLETWQHRRPHLRTMQRQAMRKRFSWVKSARQYVKLYRSARKNASSR